MNQQLKEIERYFIKASDLLSVFVKHLKQENMRDDVLHLIATTYTTIERAKGIAKDIDRLHNRGTLKAEDQYQLYMFEDIKQNLMNEIRAATKSLELKANLITLKYKDLSVIQDLDKATGIFKGCVIIQRLHEIRTLINKK